jgi:hypothetical protein
LLLLLFVGRVGELEDAGMTARGLLLLGLRSAEEEEKEEASSSRRFALAVGYCRGTRRQRNKEQGENKG